MKDKIKSIATQIGSKGGNKLGAFWSTAITLIIIYVIIKWGVPLISRKITGLPFPLSVPGTLMLFYMVLVIFALYIYISFSEERIKEFPEPIKKLLLGEYGAKARTTVTLTIVPLNNRLSGLFSNSSKNKLANIPSHTTSIKRLSKGHGGIAKPIKKPKRC